MAVHSDIRSLFIGKKKRLILFGTAFAVFAVIALLFYKFERSYVLDQAERRVRDVMLECQALHQYVQQDLHPALYELKKQERVSQDFYSPELLSSSYIARNLHQHYNDRRKELGLPEVQYKLASISPRNPVNKADSFEKSLISMFNENPEVTQYRDILEVEDQKYLYYAMPFIRVEEKCLKCHGTREMAPLQLQERYDNFQWTGGFSRRLGEVVAIESIRSPLQAEFKAMNIILACFTGIAAVFAFLFFVNTRLRVLVRNHTRALLESEERYRSVVDNIGTGVTVISPEMRILTFNKKMKELFPRIDETEHPLCYHTFNDPPVEDVCPNCPVNETLLDGQVHETETEKPCGDEPRYYRTISSPIKDEDGVITNVIEMVEDVTLRKQAEEEKICLEEQLRKTQKMEAMGTLAGGIAHDFNNILSAIFGFSELALLHFDEEERLKNDINEVVVAATRAKDLVRQILDFSRQAGNELRPIQVKLIVKEALKLMRASLPATIKVKPDIQSRSLVMGDPTQIHQIVMNLCTNAGHSMLEKGGDLEVELKEVELDPEFTALHSGMEPGTHIRLKVSDTGHGIPPNILSKIFDPFFTTKEEGEGTGMGLSAVHGIVKSCGGTIDVFSEPGKGTTFNVFFPVVHEELEPDIKVAKPIFEGTGRILLVDDEESLVKLGKEMLESLGYEVITSTSSLEALDAFKAQPDRFDLVITDMTMPNMPGDELARKVLALRPNIPIILCTGFSSRITEEKAKSMGIRELVMKPILKEDFADIIRKAMGDCVKSETVC